MDVSIESSSGVHLFRPPAQRIDPDEAEILADAGLMTVIEERLGEGLEGSVDIDDFIQTLDD